MRRYQTIIIDDEPIVSKALEIIITDEIPEIEIIANCTSAAKGREVLSQHEVDIIFLDINMPEEDGFEFLSSLNAFSFAVIFITAYQEYALKALKANAVDYLLKPIVTEELKEAFEKAKNRLRQRENNSPDSQIYSQSIENLFQQLQTGKRYMQKITVAEQFGFRIVNVQEIRYLEADGNYTIIHLDGIEKIVACRPLGEYERILDPPLFFRIHKSTIVNLMYLKAYSSYQGHDIILTDDTRLTISRRRLQEFREAVKHYSRNPD